MSVFEVEGTDRVAGKGAGHGSSTGDPAGGFDPLGGPAEMRGRASVGKLEEQHVAGLPLDEGPDV